MLIKIKKLIVETTGSGRHVSIEDIYLNSSSILSVSNYQGVKDFLLSEELEHSCENFSLVRVSDGNHREDIIAVGSAEQIYSQCVIQPEKTKILLSD